MQRLCEHFNILWTWWTVQELCSEWSMAVNIRGAAQAGACTAVLFLIPLQWDMLLCCSHVKREVDRNSGDPLHRSAETLKFRTHGRDQWDMSLLCLLVIHWIPPAHPKNHETGVLSPSAPPLNGVWKRFLFQEMKRPDHCGLQGRAFPLLRNLVFVWIIPAADTSCRVLTTLGLVLQIVIENDEDSWWKGDRKFSPPTHLISSLVTRQHTVLTFPFFNLGQKGKQNDAPH